MSEQRVDPFLTEYSSASAVQRYSRNTAGYGINYLLEHEYGEIYRRALEKYLSAPVGKGIRLIEFGCGAGMNLAHLVSLLERKKIPLDAAYGTDFSETMVEAAGNEIGNSLPPGQQRKVKFLQARNESLSRDMMAALGASETGFMGSFHLIVGVNTFRYCHRLQAEKQCAKDIYDLLLPGGVCVMIDMNRKFPMFRSMIRDWLQKPENERYLPSLAEYASAFRSAGFRVLEERNTCWIPHSAGPTMLGLLRMLTPVLNALVPQFAMRSLVISKKPE